MASIGFRHLELWLEVWNTYLKGAKFAREGPPSRGLGTEGLIWLAWQQQASGYVAEIVAWEKLSLNLHFKNQVVYNLKIW